MKRAMALILTSLFTLSSATLAMAASSNTTTITGLDGGIYFDLTDSDYAINQDNDFNGFKGYHYWTNTFFYIDKSINNNVHVGTNIKLEASSSGSKAVFDLYPYVKWDYKPWTITAGMHQGEKAGWSEDFDACWWQVLENIKAPGVEVNYEIKNGFNYTTVVTTPEGSGSSSTSSGEALYKVLNKLVYDHNGFRLGGGYQTDHSTSEDFGYWDVFTGFSVGEVVFDAEYQERQFQLSTDGYTNYPDDKTSAVLVNATYKDYPWIFKWRYWQAFNPGFTTIIAWHADPERYYFSDIDNDYNLYDRVRKLGIESQLAGMDMEYKLSSKKRFEGLFYYSFDLGTSHVSNGTADYDLSDYDKFSYRLTYEDTVTPNLTMTYNIKALDQAHQVSTKLEYQWMPGLRTNLEVGYGKIQDDVSDGESDHLMWIARMLVTYW